MTVRRLKYTSGGVTWSSLIGADHTAPDPGGYAVMYNIDVRVWPIVLVCGMGCSDTAPGAPGIETTVVEVKPVAEAPKPPVVTPPPPPPVVTQPPAVKHVAPPANHKTASTKKEPAGSAAPPPDPNKPTLEQNPYLYK
jgi:hypothetical protein